MDKRLLLKIVAVAAVAVVISAILAITDWGDGQGQPQWENALDVWDAFRGIQDPINQPQITIQYNHMGGDNMSATGSTTKTLVSPSDIDSYISDLNPNENYGEDTNWWVGYDTGAPEIRRGVMSFVLPSPPVDGAVVTGITLRIHKNGEGGGNLAAARSNTVYLLDRDFVEGTGTDAVPVATGVTWNNYASGQAWTAPGGDYTEVLGSFSVSQGINVWYEVDISRVIGIEDTTWGNRVSIILISSTEGGASDVWDAFRGVQDSTNNPQIVVSYSDPAPGKIIDFTAKANSADPRKVGFGWSMPDDKDLVEINIRRKNAASVAYTDTTVTTNRGATITDLSPPETDTPCYDTTDLPEDTTYYFAGFLEDSYNTTTDSTKSNEVSIIRDSVSLSKVMNVSDNLEGTNIDVLGEVFYAYDTDADEVTKVGIHWGEGSRDEFTGKNAVSSALTAAAATYISSDTPYKFEVGDKAILTDGANVHYFIVSKLTSDRIYMDRSDAANAYAGGSRVLLTRTFRYTEPRASFNPYIEIYNGYGMLSDSVSATTAPDPIEAAPSVLCTLSPNPVLANETFTFGFGNSVGNNYDQAIDLIGYNLDDGTGWQTTTAMKVQDTHASAGTKKIRCTVNEGNGTSSHSRGPRFEYVKTASGAVYTDITTESYSSVDANIFAVNNDYLYLGAKREFRGFYPYLVPAAHASDVFTYEYYNGSWTALTIAEDNSSDFTAAGDLIFTMPTDWEKTTVDSDEAYWVRIRITTGPTNPPITEQFITALFEGVNYFDLVVESDAAIDLSSSSVLTNSYHDINYGHKSSVTSLGANSPAVSIDGNHPIPVKMSGVAVTDSGTFQGTYTANVPDFNGTPNTYADDIEVLNDIYKNQRRVSIPGPTGTTLKGYISSFPMNYKGGHGYKGFWNITLLVTE